jgi:hypothetical protein
VSVFARPPELFVGGRSVCLSGQERLEALLGADLPDRLTFEWLPGAPGAVAVEAGETVALLIGGSERFRGRVERTDEVFGSAAGPLRFTARPEWSIRAAALPFEEEYAEATDSEAAARLADALGLRARIEPTLRVHRSLLRRGDPIEFLKLRGLASGRLFALGRGNLHFASSLPADTPVRAVGRGSPIVSSEALKRAEGRRGSFILAGGMAVFPLDRLRLAGFGPAQDGLQRVARVRIAWGSRGIATEVLWIEDERDLPRLSEEDLQPPEASLLRARGRRRPAREAVP